MDSSLCIGIDVSEAWLDVAVHPSRQHWRSKTSPAARASLSKRLNCLSPRVIAFEASGGYERPLAEALTQAALPFAIVNPRNVRSYARSIGVLAKTDRIDAAVIAEFAHVTKVEPKTPPSPAEQAARDLVTRRAQLIADQTREMHHSRHASGPSLASAERHLAFLKQEIPAVEQELRQVITADDALRQRWERLMTVPGVGAILAAVLVATLPELGRINRGAVAMLGGVAPLARDSGKSEGKRFCWGGRSIVRTALYMPMLSAIQHNPAMHALYQRLIGRGKPRKVAITACMRKMLTILNAILRKETTWNPQTA